MKTLRLMSLLGIFLGIAMMTIMMAAAPPPACAYENYYSFDSGYWSESSKWSAMGDLDASIIPGGNEEVTGITNDKTVTIAASYHAYAGNPTVFHGALDIYGTLHIGYMDGMTKMYMDFNVGTGAGSISGSGTSVVKQYAGSSVLFDATGTGGDYEGGDLPPACLHVGDGSSGSGRYELQGGLLDAQSYGESEYIGSDYGTGTFVQSGGTNKTVGLYIGANGTYTYSGGSLIVTNAIGTGTGTLIIDGNATGNITAGSGINVANFNVGNATGATGSFTLASGKTLTATTLGLGNYGTGTLTLNGGTLQVGTGGIVNGSGTGTLNIDGGAITGSYTAIAADNFNVGNAVSTNGSFTLASGKTLTSTTENIGKSGTGAFTQSGGTNQVNTLRIGTATGSKGMHRC